MEGLTMDEKTFWNYIKSLEGTNIYTVTNNEKNTIIGVEDSGSNGDRVNIEGRDSFPTREDLWAAYQLLIGQNKLTRSPDLDWLSKKRVSSVTFAIIGTLPGVSIKRIGKRKPILLTNL